MKYLAQMETREILICQHETRSALELQQRLEGSGYVVTAIASNGLQALNLAEDLRPDLALIDMGIDGELSVLETAAMLAESLKIPSIYLVDRIDMQNLKGAQLTDAVGFIIKPLRDDELCTCIELGLSVYREREELVSNLNWHRSQLDASLTCISELQAKIKSLKTCTFLPEDCLAIA